MEFEVTNGRKIELFQKEPDGPVQVFTFSADGRPGRRWAGIHTISPGDFVMLLNWYVHQKRNGNESLTF